MKTHSPTTRRRGVLLLVVLALLALFGMIAAAFVILSGQARRSADNTQKIEQNADFPENDLNEAAMQVLRGPSNAASVIGPHSLQEDLNGVNWFAGTIPYPWPITGTPEISAVRADSYFPNPNPPNDPIYGAQIISIPVVAPLLTTAQQKMRQVGCVLTMTSGPLAGQSTRIIGYYPSTDRFQLAGFSAEGITVQTEQVGSEYIGYVKVNGNAIFGDYQINSPPFSGTGLGYNTKTGKLDLSLNLFVDNNHPLPQLTSNPAATPMTFPVALLPNTPLSTYSSNILTNPENLPLGNANEDIDVPDYQDVLLGAQVPSNGAVATLPSLHRPALITYWYNRLFNDSTVKSAIANDDLRWKAILQPYGPDHIFGGTSTDDPCSGEVAQYIMNVKRRIFFRPLPEDHPNFNGSNPGSLKLPIDPTDPNKLLKDTNTTPIPLTWERCYSPLTLNVWNPAANSIEQATYQYDVDNDGDGKPDSVWVDLGFPVRSAPDGRKYKPLFAILCVDLDGRLNLNAHGNLAQARLGATYGTTVNAPLNSVTNQQSLFAGNTIQATGLLWSQGYGPADVSLQPVLDAYYTNLLTGSGDYEGRYGKRLFPGSTQWDPLTLNKWFEYGGNYIDRTTGMPSLNANDAGAYGSPPDLQGAGAVGLDPGGRPLYVNYGTTPTELQNLTGAPAAQFPVGTSLLADLPYSLNLSPSISRRLSKSYDDSSPWNCLCNNPFSVNELERILRPFDRDTTALPARLAALTSPSGLPQYSVLYAQRHNVTTESWDVPACAVGLSAQIRKQVQDDLAADSTLSLSWLPLRNITDLYRAAVYHQLRASGTSATTARDQVETQFNALTPQQILQLLPTEMLSGLKFNLNRPFGNGRDDPVNAQGQVSQTDGVRNGVVDEPSSPDPLATTQNGESGVNGSNGESVTLYNTATTSLSTPVSYDPRGPRTASDPAWPAGPAGNSLQARQDEARYLYVMAMMSIDKEALKNQLKFILHPELQTPPPATDLDLAKYLAQWAVNVVDFRDRDSIMTPFEYDVDPLTASGWRVDGVLGTNPATGAADDKEPYRGIVWGTERPELLISETLAFHDRRTENLDNDDGKKSYKPDPKKPETKDGKDTNLDQRKKPKGSLFIELYNPWTDSEPPPAELYASVNNITGVDLTRRAAGGGVNAAPVWRMLIIYGKNGVPDPKNPDESGTPGDGNNRCIYFAKPPDQATLDLKDNCSPYARYYPDPDDPHAVVNLVPRRSYAVIGPGKPTKEQDTGEKEKFDTGLKGYVTLFGRMTQMANPQEEPDVSQVRHFLLSPQSPQPKLVYRKNGKAVDTNDGTIQNVVPIVINAPRRLSVSEPLDRPNYYPEYDKGLTYYNPPKDEPLDRARKDDEIRKYVLTDGTTTNFCTIHLQRLANPLLTYNVDTNPYRTIDSSPVDLLAFNGWEDDSSDESITKGTPMAEARQRGDGDDAGKNNLWAQPLNKKLAITQSIDAKYVYKYNLQNTQGYLNTNFGDHYGTNKQSDTNPYYFGDPRIPFPWFTWNNRPFVNEMELMLVPAASSYNLLRTFSLNASNPAPYQENVNNYSYKHLLNFFASDTTESTSSTVPGLFRLLEYVGVPSRFMGTEIQANPTFMAAGSHCFHPPFNAIPNYREPGKINLNTVFSREVLQGLLNVQNLGANDWQKFVISRRGYSAPTLPKDILCQDPNCPTEFAQPFRASGDAVMAPPLPVSPSPLVPDREVDATLLRADPDNANAPLFGRTSANAADNTDRNPYFRYQILERMANSASTRSNVYAVWITEGYFEVTPATNKALITSPVQFEQIYPDGYELGQELGSDTGEITRHRGFYIIDRSIPAGFQRGKDLNVEQTILLKRFIE